MYSAIALAKMAYQESIPVLIDLIFHSDKKQSSKVKRLLKNVDVRISKNIDKIVKHIVTEEIEKIIGDGTKSMKRFNRETLLNLVWLYSLIEEYEEVEAIENYLKI